jgi:hypothetical protein
LRTEWRKLVSLSDRVAAALIGREANTGGLDAMDAQKTGLSETKSPPHFWPGTQISENVAGGPEILGDASREGILRTLRAAKIGQPAQPLIIDAGLDRGLPSTLGTTPFVESFLYGI